MLKLDKLTKLEDECLGDHQCLCADDNCYFFIEYTSGRDYTHGLENDLISNLKKSVCSSPDILKHKNQAIQECSKGLCEAINHSWFRKATLVPIPPSKVKTDSEYDDRMFKILKGIDTDFKVDVRELVLQNKSFPASHISDVRISYKELLQAYSINEKLADPAPTAIGIVDDVLTAGTHYCAMKTILKNRFPSVCIVGFFIARRVFPSVTTDNN